METRAIAELAGEAHELRVIDLIVRGHVTGPACDGLGICASPCTL
jgi:hypothetical protein